MPLLTSDVPFGQPAFALSIDQIATVLDLVCRGAREAQGAIEPGMLEVPTTMIVRKAMRRAKKTLALTNLEIRGEHELENMATTDAAILGRIDITLKFLHQFGDEDAYVAIECKRVGAGLSNLNAAIRPDPCCPIIGDEIVQRPHHIDQILNLTLCAPPHVLIAMWELGWSARMNFDALRQIEIKAVTPGAKHHIRNSEYEGMTHKITGNRRMIEQRPKPLSVPAIEIAITKWSIGKTAIEFLVQAVDP